jgi:cell division protein FtsQ
MHQRKSKKIVLYFFLLIIFASINNINLNKIKFKKVNNISINGLNDVDHKLLLNDLKSLDLENLFLLNRDRIINLMDTNTLIENYIIYKKYPSTLKIKIKKTNFLAKVNLDNQEYLIGSNGKLTKSNYSNDYLPYIFGKPEIHEFLKFKKIIDDSKISYKKIKSFYYFKSKRWDIELKNNILIKLSEENTKKSLVDAFLFLKQNNIEKNMIIDARISNQIIIDD